MKEAVIVSAVRTPIGKFNGTLKDIPAPNLGAIVIEEAVKRTGLGKEYVEEVIMGNVVTAGLGQNPARQAMIYAGLPEEVGAVTINKVCGSGLKSVMFAANAIKAGEYNIVVAGGMENMTRCPHLLPLARQGYRLGYGTLVDSMIKDGLWDVYNDYHMGMTGERIAEKYNLTREEIDKFSVKSHKKAYKAIQQGKFKEEIVPVKVPQRKGDPVIFDTDEGVRPDAKLEDLAKLKPVFKDDGIVTAGNSSQISDGASAVVVMDYGEAIGLGVRPLAKILGYNTAGVKPEDVMEAPIPAVEGLLDLLGLTEEDIDLWEHNEAFASASVAMQKYFQIPDKKFNVRGGAVALGHPIGCSGARVLTTLLYSMKDRKAKKGLATLCLGGGNAVAMVVER